MNKSINPETVLSTTRAECLRGMESANMDARMAWYYTHCGEIEMASFLGAITNDRMNDLEREWREHKPIPGSYPDRQRDAWNRNRKVKQCISRCCQESGIFEEAKKRQVEQDGSCQKPPVRFPNAVDTKCERPVGKRTQEKQQYINGFTIRIEQDTGGKQRRVF